MQNTNYLSFGGTSAQNSARTQQINNNPALNQMRRVSNSSNALGSQNGRTSNVNYGTTGHGGEQFNVRTHLSDMENALNDLVTELKYHRQQVSLIKSEKETLNSVLNMKIEDARKTVLSEEKRVRIEMDKQRQIQGQEGERLNFQIKALSFESQQMSQKLLSMQRRIQDREHHLGIFDER